MAEGIQAVRKALRKVARAGVEAHEWRNSVVLTGRVSLWRQKIKAGHAAAHKGYKGVINDIEVEGLAPDSMEMPLEKDNRLQGQYFDVVIIGGGVIGTLVARELRRYSLRIAVFEKEEDLATHASGRNDGMIHPGFAPSPKSKKAKYNVRGNRAYTRLCQDLGVKLRRPGSIILFRSSSLKALTPLFITRARQNRVDGYKYLNKQEVRQLEPNVTPRQHGGFFLPSAGVLSPYALTTAGAENAIQNGAEFYLNTAVTGFKMEGGHIARIQTNRGNVGVGIVVNAAGVWADRIADLAQDRFFSIHPRKGMDAVLDMKTAEYQTRILGMPPGLASKEHTKGGGVVPTVEGNLLVGPTAEEVSGREDYCTNAATMAKLLYHLALNTRLKRSDIITYFAGTRACTYEEDFIIEASDTVDNLVYAAGIQSPGLASAPAIAEDVSKMCVEMLKSKGAVLPNRHFNPVRQCRPELKELTLEERAAIIKKNPSYGRIVCRCEAVSEGEIRDALHSPIPAASTNGIKRRTRAGMGRCQGGFCTCRVMQIMAEELGIKLTEITKKGARSAILLSETKAAVDYAGKRTRSFVL